MFLTNLLISTQIVLTCFFIYRVQRFLRTHQTWELCVILLVFSILAAIGIQDGSQLRVHQWLPMILMVVVFLMALEPELLDITNQLIQSINPNSISRKRTALTEIAKAVQALAATKTGALIAFERNNSLLKFGATGIEINADIKKELLTTLFTKDTPTHDGGVLIRKGKATHCGAVFPLSERKQIEEGLGTRHRAALGLTEKTDAVCLVVSEEEGTISLARDGELFYSIPPRQLESKMRKLLSGKTHVHYYPAHYLRRLAPKLAQTHYVQFSKSLSQHLYDLIVVIFWLCALLLWNQYAMLDLANFKRPIELFFNAPWVYAPLILFGLNLGTLLLNRKLTVNGVTNQIKQENRLLFIPLFGRKLQAENLKAVILKHEHSARDVWSLGFLNKKQKTILIDRGTSQRALIDAAKKIRDALRIELII